MMTGQALLVLAVAVLCSSATGDEVGRSPVVPAVYVFGDSLVDAGNNDFLPPPAPQAVPPNGVDLPSWVNHRTGRFTNGFNLADIIAQHVGFKMSPPAYLSLTNITSLDDLIRGRVGANYASGGSGILHITGYGAMTLLEQVQLFTDTKITMVEAGLVGRERLDDLLARSLFVVSTGGNEFDVFDDDGGIPMSEAPAFTADLVAAYIYHISKLYRLGARKLAILDIMPIGCLPSQRAITANGTCDANGNTLSEMFNAVLRVEMAKAVAADMPGMTYSIAGVYNAFSDMIANPALAGLHEVETGCCGGGKFNGEMDCDGGANLCADRSEYLFWDKVHGTEAAYRRAVHAFFYGTTTSDAEPINLAQLVGAPSSKAPAEYSYSSM